MEQITKAITMEKALADRIQELAHKERRSFAREAQVLLETALERYKQLEEAEGSETK
jgi:predicted transcriptional regulator